ncbi:MAG: DUF2207 domain-containing protein [Cyanobacteria bacterium P01_G01_bin.39]
MNLLSNPKIASLLLLGFLLTLFTSIPPININTDNTHLPFYWDSINVAIEVEDNGDMLVTETQKYIFNREYSNKRYRYIPLDKVDDIQDVTVSEKNSIIPSQVSKKNNQLWIKWKHELNPPESHTFVIKYRVIDGLHVNTDNTQVYWKAIFSDRNSPIENAKVSVKLPKSLAGKINYFTYYADSIPVSSRKLDSQTVEFIAQKSIPPRKELEVEVVFPNDILNMQKSQGFMKNTIEELGIDGIISLILGILFIFGICFFVIFASLRANKTSPRSQSNSRRSSGFRGGASGGDSCGGGGGGDGGGGDGGGGDGGGG